MCPRRLHLCKRNVSGRTEKQLKAENKMYPAKHCNQIFPPSHSTLRGIQKRRNRTFETSLLYSSVQARRHEGAFRGRANQMTACVPQARTVLRKEEQARGYWSTN